MSPPGAVTVHLGRQSASRRLALARVGALPGGAPVVLAAAAPGARRRCRRFAAQAGIVPEREYLAFPTAAAPGCLIEDERPTVGVFLDSVLAVPPRVPLAPVLRAAVAVLRVTRGWRLLRLAAPGRVVVGRRR